MNVEAAKLELINLLLQTKKESLLVKIKKLLEEESDWYKEMSSEEQEEIKNGLVQADSEKYITNKDVLTRFDKWH